MISNVREILIDECLSPELVGIARARGCGESTHVTWLGMRSRKDRTIVRRAVADGYVLATNNATDFRALFEREAVHAGLVCINIANGLMGLDAQKRLFAFALDLLGDQEPINELLDVTLDEQKVVHVERYDSPPTK